MVLLAEQTFFLNKDLKIFKVTRLYFFHPLLFFLTFGRNGSLDNSVMIMIIIICQSFYSLHRCEI